MSKRGPKPSGVESVVFYRRVPKEIAVRLEAYLTSCKQNWGAASPPASNGPESKGKGVLGPVYQKVLGGAVQVDPFYKGDADTTEVTLLKREVDVLKNQLSQMTASYEGEYKRAEDLVIDLGNLKDELEQVAGWSEDDKTKYWRGRALQAELTLKGKTNEYDQG